MDKKKVLPLVLSGLIVGSTLLAGCSKKSANAENKTEVKKMEKMSGEKSGCSGKSSCKDKSSCGDGSSCS